LSDNNPYQAYAEGSVFSEQPIRLVVALYEGALEAARQAERCLEARDIWGRGKAVNKAIAILSELLITLDEEKGGEIAHNLKRLYHYLQKRLIEAHSRQNVAPLREVQKLLGTMLEGWRGAAEKLCSPDLSKAAANVGTAIQPHEGQAFGDQWGEPAEVSSTSALSF
jgi:flagellar secretion chaperone FliS